MKKNLILLVTILSICFTVSIKASPIQCLLDRTESNQGKELLTTNHVSFWNANRALTHAYSFTAKDPNHPLYKPDGIGMYNIATKLGERFRSMASGCGCTTTPSIAFETKVEGLCGNW